MIFILGLCLFPLACALMGRSGWHWDFERARAIAYFMAGSVVLVIAILCVSESICNHRIAFFRIVTT